MAIDIDTGDYWMAHGREPRGRGSWAFFTNRKMDVCDEANCFWTPGHTTFRDAKRLAKQWAAEKGMRDGTLYVGT